MSLKIAIAQINATVGDFAGNRRASSILPNAPGNRVPTCC
jgi:predicted amidohydrolase